MADTTYKEVGQRLKLRRKALGMTLQDVGDKLHCTPTTVRRWEEGQVATLKHTRLMELASALDTTPGYILGFEPDDPGSYPGTEPIPHTKRIPVIGTVSCGKPILAVENYDEVVQVPDAVPATFAVRVKGDSMIGARIFDGDLVFCKEQPVVENGEIAAVLIGDEVVLKRVYRHESSMELRSENPMYPPMNYEDPVAPEIRILGKAVQVLGEVR